MKREVCLGIAIGLGVLSFSAPALSQIASDGTLSTPTFVPPSANGKDFLINNGTRSGNNLFHSFSQFSIPTTGSAVFNNATDIQNIFSRVTGSQLSNIDGILKTQGGANLFLMNPNGIIFGPNAKLELGGSFVGTTASSIKFSDAIEFNTVNTTPALLSINVPIGLQIGSNPGDINVNGPGHRLVTTGAFTPIDRSNNPTGLSVGLDRSLVLIGGKVSLVGGIISTQGGGYLEIGSVQEGQVKLSPLGLGWRGDYSNVQRFNDIHLAQQSLIDATGLNGSIQLVGKDISLTEASAVMNQSFGPVRSEGINIQAIGTLNLTGSTLDGRLGSLIYIDNFGTGVSGDINVTSAQMNLSQGGAITNRTFSPSDGGKITINTIGSMVVDGVAPANPVASSSISTTTYNSKNAGDITIVTGNLSILNSGSVSSLTVGSGQAGIVSVNAKGTIEVAGINGITFTPSTLVSTSFGTGNARDILINTAKLVVQEGGIIGSSAYVTADAGNVIINASESLTLQGRPKGSITASRIASTAEILDPLTQAAYGLPPVPMGNAGSLVINTPTLQITDEAYITVKNDGPGKAGNLEINSRSIFLNNQGSITASTTSGNGGNIQLTLQDALILRHDSKISATAAGQGAGGNLSIDAPIILGLENSDIIANAQQGRGGNIQITTQGILGLKYRTALTAENDITASSEFGINGSVQVNTIGINPANALNTLPIDVVDSSTQIADRCGAAKTSSFIATGRGGMPQGPMKKHGSDRPWHDLRTNTLQTSAIVTPISQSTRQPIVEATAIEFDETGAIALVAPNPISAPTAATCGMGESH
jgi:filamentous hemagglutinin family protein